MTNKGKIDYIIENERFPIPPSEKRALIIISCILFPLALLPLLVNFSIYKLLFALTLPALIVAFLYFRIKNMFRFHKIETGFGIDKNTQLIEYCLQKMNRKSYRNEEYSSVFVCFVHHRKSQREEIYLIAKEHRILIASSRIQKRGEHKNKDSVYQIGGYIYEMARKL